jgi:hypothetical protein
MTSEDKPTHHYTDEEIRHAINADTPVEGLEIALKLFQRMTLALEGIAQSMLEPPTVLFEQVPHTDGLGQFDSARGDDDKEH